MAIRRGERKPRRKLGYKLEVDGSLIPNSQKVSPSPQEIRDRCLAIQATWDEITEQRRRLNVDEWTLPVLHVPYSLAILLDSLNDQEDF